MVIKKISLEQVYPLRSSILRPGQPIESCHYPEDDKKRVFHLGAVDAEGHIVGIASFYPEDHSELSAKESWRLRGMATSESVRGTGVGRLLLEAGIESCCNLGADLLWCNARSSASAFYRKLNFDIKGDEFMIKNIGSHFLMYYKY